MESMVRFPDNKFATLLQNELNSQVARFTTHIRTCPASNKVARFFFLVGKMPAIAVQLILQQCCKTSRMSFVARVTVFY